MLLKEKQLVQTNLQEMQIINQDLKKQNHELQVKFDKQQMQTMSFHEDQEELQQLILSKEQIIKDTKNTLHLQNSQIETIRSESACLQDTNNELRAKQKELSRTVETMKRLETTKVTKQENNEANLYQLTVQLGCVTEENNSLHKDLVQLKQDFTERLTDQRENADQEYL